MRIGLTGDGVQKEIQALKAVCMGESELVSGERDNWK